MKTTHSLAVMIAACAMLISTGPLRASETDDRIEASAKNSYIFRIYLTHDAIKTVSENGVVTLTGAVANASHKSLAQDTVEGLPGVTSVDNQLTVKAGAPVEGSDGWLSLKVESALLFHPYVNCRGTDVSVEDGVVRLRGEASSPRQKELTGAYAKDVAGVKEVKNEMTIARTGAAPVESIEEKIDYASITAEVKASLMWHSSTSAIQTKVQTTGGVVTVSGIAKSAFEKDLATRLATDINGVRSVINNMDVQITAASNN